MIPWRRLIVAAAQMRLALVPVPLRIAQLAQMSPELSMRSLQRLVDLGSRAASALWATWEDYRFDPWKFAPVVPDLGLPPDTGEATYRAWVRMSDEEVLVPIEITVPFRRGEYGGDLRRRVDDAADEAALTSRWIAYRGVERLEPIAIYRGLSSSRPGGRP